LQGIHKFTIVVRTTPDQVDKLVRQVEKKIDVLKTFVYTTADAVVATRRTYVPSYVTTVPDRGRDRTDRTRTYGTT